MSFTGETYSKSKVFVVILAGGRGARFDHETQVVPKPLIEVAGKPMLGHIMDLYEAQGFYNFVVLGGYMWEKLDEYLSSRYECNASAREHIKVYGSKGERPKTHLFLTGDDATTGDRLMTMAMEMFPPNEFMGGSSFFLLTYGDGLCNVNINSLIETHLAHRHWKTGAPHAVVTLTAIRPPGRFGVLEFDFQNDEHGPIAGFLEKNQQDWINGGFMVVDVGVIPRWVPEHPDQIITGGPFESFEEGALPRLAVEGKLFGYKHDDYWRCMDNRRDLEQIEIDVKNNDGELPWLKTVDPG